MLNQTIHTPKVKTVRTDLKKALKRNHKLTVKRSNPSKPWINIGHRLETNKSSNISVFHFCLGIRHDCLDVYFKLINITT